jgi:predicted acetylornithine/succinylornithine family transaminase
MPNTVAARKKSKAAEKIALLESTYLFNTYKRSPLFIRRGRGVTVWDVRGKSYIDMLGGIAVNALGYGHPRILKVMRRQMASGVHFSNLFYHPYQGELAKKLVEISGLARAFFTNSGTEAVEAAFKIARAYAARKGYTGKFEIVALENSFHGRTLGALSATGTEKYRKPFEPLIPGIVLVRPNCIEDLEAAISERTCAVIIEPIQGEGGVVPMQGAYMQAARVFCDRRDALLIFDEIQCGLGRTGRYFQFQKFGLEPDLLTIAKPLAAGLPLGAVLGAEKVAQALAPGDHGTTFGGGPLACRVAMEFLAVLEEENLLPHVTAMGEYLRQKLLALQGKFDGLRQVRGEGLMIGIEFASNVKPLAERLLEAGFITNVVHDKIMRLLPPYIIEKQHIDAFISAFEKILLTSVQPSAVSGQPETQPGTVR